MEELFHSGRVVDLVLAFVLVEAAVVFLHYRPSGRGLAPGAMIALLLPGVCLLLALRAAITGADWPSLAFWLLAALLAHLVDLRRRWRR
ncbi:MAG: hypothetical protein Kow00114_02760 [Kiloniellaceae bacterium]